jgi:hypothetical protein
MANKVTVELSAKDGEMVAAWQRSKNSLAEFEEGIKRAHHKTESWGGEFKKDLADFGKGLTASVGGFELMKKGVELVEEAYGNWSHKIDEVITKQRESRAELTHTLALAGKLADSPKVEEALKSVEGAKREEAKAAYTGVSNAAPELSTDQQLDLTRQVAPLAAAVGEQGVEETGRVAGTLQKVAPGRSAFDVANMAHVAMQQVDARRRGELSDPGSLRALEILQGAGMSTEKGLAFETEAMSKGMLSKDLEKIGDEISSGKNPQEFLKSAGHSPEAMAQYKFYSTAPGQARLDLLMHDRKTAQAVLGGKESERLGLMDEKSIAAREAQLAASHEGSGAIGATIEAQERVHPLDMARRKMEEQEHHAHAKAAKRKEAWDTQTHMATTGMMNLVGRNWLTEFAAEKGEQMAGAAFGLMPEKTQESMVMNDQQMALASSAATGDLSGVVRGARAMTEGGGNPMKETNDLLREQNRKLDAIASNGKQQPPHVVVNVQGGGGGRRDMSARSDHSPAAALGNRGGEGGTL